eukprot:CAMPEP_0114563630 /NCGR_PEP_ID=MMETSP0114-20121206/13225_1 /TAXON_ID=31324 /ORGANISM="Goniomonas sp, Strain m" /LENGTH=404 /DNA_ID=CAMNT_0001749515 /DNA_START=37 /DNA_END=1251 /DNA_ORIENTATION=-
MASDPTLIELLEQQADAHRAPMTPKDVYSPARMKPSGVKSAMSVGLRSGSPRRDQSPARTAQKLAEELLADKAGSALRVSRLGLDERSFRINLPQRVEPPRDLKTPRRIDDFEDSLMHLPSQAPKIEGFENEDNKKKRTARKPGNIASKIKDYNMLAAACRRAGRSRDEGMCYYNVGVLYDNNQEYLSAIKFYQQFVDVCKSVGDAKGESLAYNSIGVDYQKMALLDEAIHFHQLHLEVADVPGKFVAHSNLGLAHAAKGENEKASLNHRQALRYAIVMSSLPGESLACGNLGVVGSRKGDHPTAKACMERHLKLSGALRDDKAQADAYVQLGQLANSVGDYEDASQYFEMARGMARKTGEASTATAAKCHVGMALGNLQFDEYLNQIAGKLTHPPKKQEADED